MIEKTYWLGKVMAALSDVSDLPDCDMGQLLNWPLRWGQVRCHYYYSFQDDGDDCGDGVDGDDRETLAVAQLLWVLIWTSWWLKYYDFDVGNTLCGKMRNFILVSESFCQF